jgi:hypothetical protein
MRESWTDERLDDFRGEVARRFDKVDTEFRGLRSEMNTRFDRFEARFDALQRTMLQIASGTIGTLIAGFAAIAATQL